MRYKTRRIRISMRNPIEGAELRNFVIESEQEWKRPNGKRFFMAATDNDPLRASLKIVHVTRRMVGELVFTLYGTHHRSDGYIDMGFNQIGRYKSLEAALATLRDMGVMHPDAMKTWIERYVESE